MSCWREVSCRLKDINESILEDAVKNLGLSINHDKKHIHTSYGSYESNDGDVDGTFERDGKALNIGYVLNSDGEGHFGIRGDFWSTGIDSETFANQVAQQYVAEAFRQSFHARRWAIQKDTVNADGEIEITFHSSVA